ncbi:hypothetical protein V6N13_050864 [Hibiscus sabdariffa]
MSIHRSDAGKGFVDYGEVLAFQSPAILSGDRLVIGVKRRTGLEPPRTEPASSRTRPESNRPPNLTLNLFERPLRPFICSASLSQSVQSRKSPSVFSGF